MLLFIVVFLFFTTVYAEENKEGILVYHVKYDYEAISKFLGTTVQEYDQEWGKVFLLQRWRRKKELLDEM